MLSQAERVKKHARSMVAEAQRPYQYLTGPCRKEELARQIAEGLVCVFSGREPCRTFSLVWTEAHPDVQPAWRKCLHLSGYVVDRQLGLIHVKLQTWCPFPIQVDVNGHAWVARRLDHHGVRYQKRDNAFVSLSDPAGAQQLADGFASVDWVRGLGRHARRVKPLLRGLLAAMRYDWGTTQAEYSTHVLFRSHPTLEELMPRVPTSRTLYFEAHDVLAFLGRRLSGNFLGEVATDQVDFRQMPKRLPGRRVKHRMKRNWMKLYNKAGVLLRVNENRKMRFSGLGRKPGAVACGPCSTISQFRRAPQRF